MIAEYLLVARHFKLAPFGGGGTPAAGAEVVVTLESGTPYRHYMAWAYVSKPAAPAGAPDVDIQPLFGDPSLGIADGAVVNLTANGPAIVFKITAEEVRPPTRNIAKHPDDVAAAIPLKSELRVTNAHTTHSTDITIYMMASAAPGGA